MSKGKKVFLYILSALILLLAGLYLTGNGYLIRGIYATYLRGKARPDIDDQSLFDTRKVKTSSSVFHYPEKQKALTSSDIDFLNQYKSEAFLVIKNDTLIKSWYMPGADTTHWNSFSMAKSVTSLLIGCAIQDGYIPSIEAPAAHWLNTTCISASIKHLLQMSGGIPFGESYNSPFGYMAKAYYGKNLEEITRTYCEDKKPGTVWSYEGGNTVLLGMLLTSATHQNLSNYMEEKIWKKLGAESACYWNIDHPGGIEKPYTGIYATPIDFAKLGSMVLHHGKFNNQAIIDSAYLEACFTPCLIPDEKGNTCTWYGLQFWMGTWENHPVKLFRGMRGQYIIVVPDLQLVVVRIGHEQSKGRTQELPDDVFDLLKIAAN